MTELERIQKCRDQINYLRDETESWYPQVLAVFEWSLEHLAAHEKLAGEKIEWMSQMHERALMRFQTRSLYRRLFEDSGDD